MISFSLSVLSCRSKQNHKFKMRLARRAVKYVKLVSHSLLKDSIDFGWEHCCVCPSLYSLSVLVAILLRLLRSRMSVVLVGGDKKSGTVRLCLSCHSAN